MPNKRQVQPESGGFADCGCGGRDVGFGGGVCGCGCDCGGGGDGFYASRVPETARCINALVHLRRWEISMNVNELAGDVGRAERRRIEKM